MNVEICKNVELDGDVYIDLDEDDIKKILSQINPNELIQIQRTMKNRFDDDKVVSDERLGDILMYEHFLKIKDKYTLEEFEERMPE